MIIALIGARSGSSLKHKNIRPLAGHPLLAYSILAALQAKNIQRVIVSTDSQEYAEIARKYGAEVPYIQPAATATATSGDYPFIAHALDWMRIHDKELPELLVHLRPTTPLRDPDVIDEAIELMTLRNQATSMRSVHEMSESAYKCVEIAGDRLMVIGTRDCDLDTAGQARHLYPKTYQPNGYIDILKPDFIRESQFRGTRQIHGDCVMPFITSAVTEVDCEGDFAMLEWQVHRNPELVKRVFA